MGTARDGQGRRFLRAETVQRRETGSFANPEAVLSVIDTARSWSSDAWCVGTECRTLGDSWIDRPARSALVGRYKIKRELSLYSLCGRCC